MTASRPSTLPSVSRFGELRRLLPLAAAVLLVAALLVPMWRITLTAPQYPGETLLIELYAYPRLGGDFVEVQGLNQYVGFYYPDPVYVDPNYAVHENAIAAPEWLLGPIVFLGLAATGAFVAVAPTVRKLKLGLTAQLVGTVGVFAGMFAFIQYRLYQAGHSLDPNAPLRGVDAFTPPLLGSYEVANISGFAWFGPGGYLTLIALVLLVISYRCRDSEMRISDVPGVLHSVISRLRTPKTPSGQKAGDSSGGSDTTESQRFTAPEDRIRPRSTTPRPPDWGW